MKERSAIYLTCMMDMRLVGVSVVLVTGPVKLVWHPTWPWGTLRLLAVGLRYMTSDLGELSGRRVW